MRAIIRLEGMVARFGLVVLRVGILVKGEERLHFSAQIGLVPALFCQKRRPLVRRQLERGQE
jgi:hypothetical protein